MLSRLLVRLFRIDSDESKWISEEKQTNRINMKGQRGDGSLVDQIKSVLIRCFFFIVFILERGFMGASAVWECHVIPFRMETCSQET